MRLHFILTFVFLFGSQTRLSESSGNQMNLHLCMDNKTVSVQILTGMNDLMTCQCQAGISRDPFAREDYVNTPGIGSYKLHMNAHTWNEARKICEEESAHLAIINSKAEEAVLLNMLKKDAMKIKDGETNEQALVGIHDLFKEGEWVTLFGQSLYSSGFAEWAYWWGTLQPDNKGNNQNCGSLVIKGGLDDVSCQEKYAFFCELVSSCAK